MKYKIIIIILVFSVFLSGSYSGDILNTQLESAKEYIFSGSLSDETFDILKKLGLDDLDKDSLLNFSAKDFFIIIADKILLNMSKPFKAILAITVSAIICAFAECFFDNFGNCKTVLNYTSALTATSVFLFPIKDIVFSSAMIINECSDFMLGFIPVYSSAITATGYVSSAIGFRTLMLSAVTIISRVVGDIAAPLIGIYLAISVSGAVSGIKTSELAKTIKNFSTWIICGTMTVFSGIMGLGTLVSVSSDNAFSKTAKFLVGSVVPVVGSTVSDSLTAIRSCLNITKNLLGTYAIIVIAVIFLPPIIYLLLWRISLSISSVIGDFFDNKILSSVLSSASSVIGIMLSLLTITSIMFIFSVTIMLMTGGGL